MQTDPHTLALERMEREAARRRQRREELSTLLGCIAAMVAAAMSLVAVMSR